MTSKAVVPSKKTPKQHLAKAEFQLTPDLIDRDGIYDLPIEKYHGNCCVGNSASGSDLVTIEQKTLFHYWSDSYHNPARVKKTSEAMEFGKAAHYLQLGETEFAKHYVISPYDTFNSDVSRAWRDQQARTVIKKKDFDAIGAMAKVMATDPLAARAFRGGKPEQSIIWKDPETGIWLKTRPDWLPHDDIFVPDFKTSASADPKEFKKRAFALGYDIKEALRVEGIKRVLGRDVVPYFLVQETKPPHAIATVMLEPPELEMAGYLARIAIRKLAWALNTGRFPSWGFDWKEKKVKAVEVSSPPWIFNERLARLNSGEFDGLYEGGSFASKRGMIAAPQGAAVDAVEPPPSDEG